jgi:hypothetical protein
VYVINTYVHNVPVADSTGAFFGAVTPRQVRLQLAALNAAYNTSSHQAGVTWLYKLANITNTSVALGADMCNEQTDIALKKRLRQGDATALNLYVTDLSQCGVLGASTWPWEITGNSSNSSSSSSSRGVEGGSGESISGGSSSSSSARGLAFDGVTVHYETLPLGELEGYATGGTTIHEVGHWLGERCARPKRGIAQCGILACCECLGLQKLLFLLLLLLLLFLCSSITISFLQGLLMNNMFLQLCTYIVNCFCLLFAAGLLHVFENGCSPPGGGVDDTPYCLPPKDESCPDSRNSCPQQPGLDPISNWMSYSVDSCMSSFSPGQLLRAERMWRRNRLPTG